MLKSVIDRFVVVGCLSIQWPDGEVSVYKGSQPGPSASIGITSKRAIRALTFDPGLALGECYMDGTLVPLNCTIYDVLDVVAANVMAGGNNPWYNFRERLGWIGRRLAQRNPAGKSRSNVAHHYDLNGRLYSLFLDRDRQYSCAYFRNGNETLEEAQAAKKHHIAAKLRLDRPGTQRAGYRLRLGRHGADAGARLRRAGHRYHALERTTRRGAGARPGRGPRRPRQFRTARLSQPRPELRPYRLGRHVSSMSAWGTTRNSSMWCAAR